MAFSIITQPAAAADQESRVLLDLASTQKFYGTVDHLIP